MPSVRVNVCGVLFAKIANIYYLEFAIYFVVLQTTSHLWFLFCVSIESSMYCTLSDKSARDATCPMCDERMNPDDEETQTTEAIYIYQEERS